jgi:uncharacterized protein (DUF1499 family)
MLNKATMLLSLGSITLLMGGILLANKEIIPSRVGLILFALSGVVGMVAVGCAIAVIFRTQAFQIVMVGMVGALPVLVLFSAIGSAMRFPPINDITTDLDDPPAFVHAVTLPYNVDRDMSYPEKWVGIVRKAYPDVQHAVIPRPLPDAFPSVLRQAQQQPGWEVTYEDANAGIIECVATTKLLKFRDDLVIRLRPEGEGKTRVDMRSKSREGRSDVGANAKRIKAFLELMR